MTSNNARPNSTATVAFMSTEVAAGGAPSAEDKARYEQLKKDLLAALPQKRALDKRLVRMPHFCLSISMLTGPQQRLNWKLRYMQARAPTSAKQPYTATEIFSQGSTIPRHRLLYGEGTKSLKPTGCFQTAARPA
jgi:hypothetical protein